MKNDVVKYSVGIDISKDKYDACFSEFSFEQDVKVKATKKINYSSLGNKSLLLWIAKYKKHDIPLTITMEATGVYYEKLALFLYEQGFTVNVVLPNKAKKYLQSLGYKSKNDKIDARGLSQMGAEQKLSAWMPFSKSFYSLRSLTRHHEQLQNLKTNVKNQAHAFEYSMHENKIIYKQQKAMIKLLEKQLMENEEEIKKVIEQDDLLKRKVENISKIRGVGLLSIATVIAETNGFYLFENQKQLVSFAGYDVIENQSGRHTGKTKISKKGNSHIRRILHMPSLTAVRLNEPVFKNLYQRIYDRSKIKMKGYVAVQKKLLITMYALWKKDEAFNSFFYKYASGNDEPKPLFSLGFKEAENKAGRKNLPAQDRLPCKESPEALFSLSQN